MKSQINKNQAHKFTAIPQINYYHQQQYHQQQYHQQQQQHQQQHHQQQLNQTYNYYEVFDRLCQRKKKSFQNSSSESKINFTPKILHKSKSLRRKQDIGQLLYGDAIRRQEKYLFSQQQLSRRLNITPTINSNTNELVCKKISSQFIELVTESQISPLVAIGVLSQIFKIDLHPIRNQKICQRILNFLVDTRQKLVQSNKLWNFISVIIYGTVNNSQFNQEQSNNILKEFTYFYTQRLTNTHRTITPQKNNFRPKTLRSSQKMAERHRFRTVESINQYIQNQKVNPCLNDGKMNLQDLFIIEYMKNKSQNQKKKIEQEKQKLMQCSFQPKINSQRPKINIKLKKKNKNNNKTIYYEQQQKQQQQYKQSKRKKSKNKNRMITSINNKQQQINVRNIDQQLYRMSLGRKNREFSQELLQRGYPKNIMNWQSYRKLSKKIIQDENNKLKGYY